MTAEKIFREASRIGLHLERRGDKLVVHPRALITPDFREVLREHKRELFDWIEAKSASLAPDCAPWLHVARQVLAGEFEGANRSTVESLTIGLTTIAHPTCRRALERLQQYEKR